MAKKILKKCATIIDTYVWLISMKKDVHMKIVIDKIIWPDWNLHKKST